MTASAPAARRFSRFQRSRAPGFVSSLATTIGQAIAFAHLKQRPASRKAAGCFAFQSLFPGSIRRRSHGKLHFEDLRPMAADAHGLAGGRALHRLIIDPVIETRP
jgi:hypothetical protein